jgi:hypothetical protein
MLDALTHTSQRSMSSVNINFVDLADRIERARTPTGFKVHVFQDVAFVLCFGFEFPDDVGLEERFNVCKTALHACNKLGVISAGRLKHALERCRTEFLLRPPQPFVLLTSIMIGYSPAMRSTRFDNSTIAFSHSNPKKYDRSVLDTITEPLAGVDDNQYAKARIHVRSRTQQGAFDSGMKSVDFIRGLWNISFNKDLLFEWTGEGIPVNRILPGPVHTLHHPDGTLAAKAYWYETPFTPPGRLPHLVGRWPGVVRDAKNLRRMIQASSFRNILVEAVVRYCRALDSREPNVSFVKLWSLLEFLTSTAKEGHDSTVRRALFFFDDEDLNRSLLEILKQLRNRSVHAGIDNVSREMVVLLHRFVREAILFVITHSHAFRSMTEVGKFLDLPRDKGDLERSQRLIRKAIQYRFN